MRRRTRPPSGLFGLLCRVILPAAAIALLVFEPAAARTLLSLEEALALAFPKPVKVTTKTVLLTDAQLKRVEELSHEPLSRKLVIRYEARKQDRLVGIAYVDRRIVRTLPCSILFVVAGDPPAIRRVEILAFNEPPDYLPRPRFTEQLVGRKLDSELSLKKAVRPMTGATLTSRALTAAARRILAIHAVIEEGKEP